MNSPAKPVIIPGLAPEAEASPRSLNPQGWSRPKGYSNGMAAQGKVVVTGSPKASWRRPSVAS